MLILDYPDWDTPTLLEEFFPKSLFELTLELTELITFSTIRFLKNRLSRNSKPCVDVPQFLSEFSFG